MTEKFEVFTLERGEEHEVRKVDEATLVKLIRSFLLKHESEFKDSLGMIVTFPEDLYRKVYSKVKGDLEAKAEREKINEKALLVPCPNCRYNMMLDSFLELSFNGNEGEYRCPKCNIAIKYNFVTKDITGFRELEVEDSFVGVNLGELREKIESELRSFYSPRVLGDTKIMVAVKVEEGLLRLLIREVSSKSSEEGWDACWTGRVEVKVNDNWDGRADGFWLLTGKWMGSGPQVEVSAPITIEKLFKVEDEPAKVLSGEYVEMANNAYERVFEVLNEAKLAVEWVYPAKPIVPSATSFENEFVAELKEKIKEKERKREEGERI